MRWTIPTLVALALAAPVAADAEEWARGPGARFDPELFEERLERHSDRVVQALDLTADQRAAFERLRRDGMAAARPRLERMRELGAELRGLLGSDAPEPAAVGETLIALHELREELRASREGFEREFAALLSEEQRFAWEALREARPRFGPGGPGGPGFGRRGGPPA